MLAVSLMLTGCDGEGGVVESGEYTIYVHGRALLPRGGRAALIEGTLAVRDGCVVLESEEAETWYPVVWPARTSIASTDPFAVRLPSGEELALGEKVSGGGGFHSRARVEVDIPLECLPETREIAVFNPDEDPSKG